MMKKVGAVFLLLLIGAGIIALGGSDTATTTVSWTVLPFASLSVVGDEKSGECVSHTFTLPSPSEKELKQGWLERKRAITLTAASNVDWEITVRTAARDLGQSYRDSYVKPLEDFQIRAAGGEYRSLSNSAKALTAGTNGRYELGIDYQILFHQERYQPGDYQITLIYTIVTD